MIDDLTVAKAATFFRANKKLTDKAVRDLFATLRENYNVSAHNIFRHVRQALDGVRWSAICFMYETPPSFLHPAAGVRDTLCGYVMLIEYQQHVAAFASRIALPASFKTLHLSPVPIARVEGAVATSDAVFRKMRMRNMSVSPYAMRNKTLEAANLANVTGPAGSRRYAPQTYTVEADGRSSSATPSTGRISVRSDRVGHVELIEFAKSVIDLLRIDPVSVSPFISTFARPMSLADALAASEPVTIAIDTNHLVDAVAGEDAKYRLVRVDGENVFELPAEDLTALIASLDQALAVEGDARIREAKLGGSAEASATISLNKTRIALRSLNLGISDEVAVEILEVALGEDPERRSLREFLDEENAFIVLFTDARLAYIDGQVFRDDTLLDGGATFLRYLHPDASLQTVTSEKGNFTAAQTAFEATSSFGAIVDHIATPDATLVCDDLGDEWADFIGIREESGLTQISFYHAKHDDLTLGAGSFHISVSQAIKNLGNMTFPQERMAAKVQEWGVTYNGDGVATQISRTIRAAGNDLAGVVERARMAPDAVRKAVIVTSSLSKQAVADAFRAIQNGQRPSHSFVQRSRPLRWCSSAARWSSALSR